MSRPTKKRRIPSVLTREEVAPLFPFLDGEMALPARLLYGTGMRLMEGLRLRIRDADFDRQVIVVHEAKSSKDRVVMLPQSVAPVIRAQRRHARAMWETDHRALRSGVERRRHAHLKCHSARPIARLWPRDPSL